MCGLKRRRKQKKGIISRDNFIHSQKKKKSKGLSSIHILIG
jgi:hypothetical protein